ncbi:trypsin-like serine peptidase [Crenothrix polyspora]|uniref:Serine protease n=1 Tax=Crenothrix polyspora TaxID=360316 RepID=A0A1R4H6B6_9GAMM|nr:trypsin-like peptidase domain-containing protein [Crenothrix polyspora]SJM91716.1 exported hypothetical protein [Crenothrix polyspora]
MTTVIKISLFCVMASTLIAAPALALDTKAQHAAMANKKLNPVIIAQAIPPMPKAVGSSKIYYTDSPVIPRQADVTFPYRAIGKLWFTKPDGLAGVCTGSVIKPGIVLTAGHCVHSGNGKEDGWFKDFKFAPGYRNGPSARYGIWEGTDNSWVRTEWYEGGGKMPHRADYALIVFKANSAGKRIGDLTGVLNYKLSSMIGHHVTVLGYSNNLDKGKINHRVDSNVATAPNNTGIFGSNMAGGSDGSPVILNFGTPATGDSLGWAKRNFVVSVVSYGTPASQMKQGGSEFGNWFESLIIDYACKESPEACSK